jgi:glycerol-3-phosphate dehydrogenase
MTIRPIDQLSNNSYDVLVIGGGINGAAIANTASLNGLKVALIEKNDFASGTSSKSTKLVHGGLRYLDNFEFDLVAEALHERAIQLKSAPHLVKPIAFVIPVYANDAKPFWMIKLGVTLYDWLSGKYIIKKHSVLSKEEVLSGMPSVKKEGLLGGVLFYDAQMNDARLCLENVLQARAQGADVANYVELRALIKEHGQVAGAVCFDRIGQKDITIRAQKVICALGPWMNAFLEGEDPTLLKSVRATKGVHIVCRQKISDQALLIPTYQDQRVLFVIPWMNHSLIGTTDTDFKGSPDRVEVTLEDIEYIFKELNRVFPDGLFKREDMIASFAGLRPLVAQPGKPHKVSRKHTIQTTPSGMMYVIGGKYTTYRKIAEDCVRQISHKKLKNTSSIFPLYGGGLLQEPPQNSASNYGVAEAVVVNLMNIYGTRYKDVLELIKENSSWKDSICACTPTIKAQLVYALRVEMACFPEDIIWRRLSLGFQDCPTKDCQKTVWEFFARSGEGN